MKHLNIKRERINREWTQGYVGKQLGMTKTAISDIETGKRKPSYDVLVKLEDLFNKSHRYLLAQVNDPKQKDYTSLEVTGTNIVELALRAWKESKEAVQALDPAIIADGIDREEMERIDQEAGEAIASLEQIREHIREHLEAA